MKIHRTLRLNKDLIEKLENLAKEENRNFSNLVETILNNYLNNIYLSVDRCNLSMD